MGHGGQRALFGMLLLSSALVAAGPAASFSIFGIRLWGEEPEEELEIIDPLPYEVELAVEGEDEEILEAVRAASALWSDREEPASGKAGLVAKARGDYRRILGALFNLGYYGPLISIELGGLEAADVTLAVPLQGPVPVAMSVVPGGRFRFGTAELVNAPRWDDEQGAFVGETPAEIGFATGEPARALSVAAASELAIERWRELSYAKAERSSQEIIADHARNELDATVVIEPGRPAVYGTVRVEGSEQVEDDFIAYMADLEPGSPFDPDELAEAQARLVRLGVFSLVTIEEGAEIGADNRLPMLIKVEDRPLRSFGVGATISTLEGLGLEGFWLHRNLFGEAEQLRFDASVSRIGAEEAPQDLTYEFGVTYTEPGVINPDTNFVGSLFFTQEQLETYFERAITLSFGLVRDFGSDFTGEIAFEIARARVEDDAFGVRHFLTLGPVARGAWDRRNDTVDPTEGFYLEAEAGPFYEAEFGNIAARGTIEGRVYAALDEDDRFVLAGRAQLGSYVGPDAAESPPGRLFFAGGGGSIRGYEYRSIGVEAPSGDDVVGGRSLLETSGELRARLSERFGLVAFVDAGYVAETSSFGGDYDWRYGAGLGARYFTGFGPLRVDVATPLNPRDDDPAVALYIGIGQAF
jgi:translocation and assembly module TamA